MPSPPSPQLESGTYEIIRKRLNEAGDGLRQRLASLNRDRQTVFGAVETKLIGSTRITTDNNCSPRDMIAIGHYFLFGYNVQIGLRSQTSLSDVFAIYQFQEGRFHPLGLDLIENETFQRDFQSLYKYYKKTVFSKFSIIGPHLFMKFRVGKAVNDFKTFKWLIKDGRLIYVDNRSDHEFTYPTQHEFQWIRSKRDWHRDGPHPHITIEDRVFVETVGGDLTIKVEDNTESGQGIYAEPVDNADQTLDDAEIYYAAIGPVIILKIKPYGEKAFRYLVFNEKLAEVHRIDAIADSCVLLPDDQGLIFPNGVYLLTGELKLFETQLKDMTFYRRIPANNGEDYLFVFFNRLSGEYILLHYNLIAQKVETPIICNGYSIFPDGKLVYFRGESDPQKHHVLQLWQTPFGDEELADSPHGENPLFDIGNKAIVKCMAECQAVLKLIEKDDSFANLYVDIVKACEDILDTYFWIDRADCGALAEALEPIQTTAEQAIDAFEKVNRMRSATRATVNKISEDTKTLCEAIRTSPLDHITLFVNFLSQTRVLRGELIAARELRYVDMAKIDALETQVKTTSEALSHQCVDFLLKEESLDSYRNLVTNLEAEVPGLEKGADAKRMEEGTAKLSGELEMLIDIVGNLKIEDPTQSTRIIDGISEIFSSLNRLNAAIRNRRKALATSEGVAEFNAQLKLLDQSIISYLDLCDTPDKCEGYLTKLMVAVEELEGRFTEFDTFLEQLTEKREEIYNAFENRRLQLLEARNQRAAALAGAADRILKGVANRVGKFKDIKEIHGYFAGDLMIEKVRDIVAELIAQNDAVKADDVQTRLKTIQEEAVRQLKDRQDLFTEGENVIQFGKHRFLVNVQNLAPTMVFREGLPFFHLTGTNFFLKVEDEAFQSLEAVWDMTGPAETSDIYRGEYLAYKLFQSLKDNTGAIEETLALEDGPFLEWVRQFMGPRYDEGYAKGIHDLDAAALLRPLLTMHAKLGLLTTPPRIRALAELFWAAFCAKAQKDRLNHTVEALASLQHAFPKSNDIQPYQSELEGLIQRFLETSELFPEAGADQAAAYLFRRLLSGDIPPNSLEAATLYQEFGQQLRHRHASDALQSSRERLRKDPTRGFQIVRTWMKSFQTDEHPQWEAFVDEAALLVFTSADSANAAGATGTHLVISGMKGEHNLIPGGQYTLDYHEFMARMRHFESEVVPRYRQLQDTKHELLTRFSETLRLEEFQPRVMASFVRNQLIDRVYLPLIGANLAKQMGTAGEGKRTDRMGMLLLVSPPGYGKTTLMEYIANRVGLIFMKINGPAIGHQVTALDPATAPNASAREELNKLNLALEMGDNIMIYLDDIQHCNPEFLQKFISLCDAQRKIEGVYGGRTRTYDLRGKKVCVVMAGNPYTESGEKFQIPDMLANRADTYNLGDIVGGNRHAFELSYIENSLTSNPVLSHLATASQKDILALIKIAQSGDREDVEFEGAFSPDAIDEYTGVLVKIMRIRDVVLKVNRQYIQSAAQEDAYRTEPPFKLQGSYRNMNKMAEQVLPIMNDDELTQLILDHYINEAQTLTSGAEANLLKFKTMLDLANETEVARWQDIVAKFAKKQTLFGLEAGDRIVQVVLQLSHFQDGLQAIRNCLETGFTKAEANRERNASLKKQPVVTQTALAPQTMQGLADLLSAWKTGLDETGDVNAEVQSDSMPAELGQAQANHLYKVLRHQFNIMHHWLKPMYDMDLNQNKALEQLHRAIETSLEAHNQLIARLDSWLGSARPSASEQQKSKPKPVKPAKKPVSKRKVTKSKDGDSPPPRRKPQPK